MNRHHGARRLAALSACVGTIATVAALGGASAAFALNEDTCTTVYGSGASVQKVAMGAQGGLSEQTTLSNTYAAGATSVQVSNASVYAVGNKIVLGFGTANAETVTISAISIPTNTLTVSATTKEHLAGDVVGIELSGVFLNHWPGTYVISGTTFGCTSLPKAAYYSSSQGEADLEFGDTTGAIIKSEDPEANADTSSPCKESGPLVGGVHTGGCLDSWVGVEEPPNAGELGEAEVAAGALNLNQLTLPVGQTPVDALLSLPANCSVTSGSAIDVTNQALSETWLATVPAGGSDSHNSGNPYPANTWGALLAAIGETGVTDNGTGAGNGCETPITLEVRSASAGASYDFKSYLSQIDSNDWSSYANDGTVWPASVQTSFGTPNKSDAEEAKHVASDPGSVGYATAANAVSSSGGSYTAGATATTIGSSASHQILWAQIQNNGINPSGATFADPLGSSKSTIANCDTTSLVPSEKGAAYSATDSWFGVAASDPSASIDTGTSTDYPLCALIYVLTWEHETPPNLFGNTGGAGEAGLVGTTTHDFLEYLIREGQTEIQSDDYTSVPAPLLAKMKAIVNLVKST